MLTTERGKIPGRISINYRHLLEVIFKAPKPSSNTFLFLRIIRTWQDTPTRAYWEVSYVSGSTERSICCLVRLSDESIQKAYLLKIGD
jgi:hypothetical protein